MTAKVFGAWFQPAYQMNYGMYVANAGIDAPSTQRTAFDIYVVST